MHHQGVDGSLKIFRWNGTGGDYGVMMDSDKVIGNTMLTQTCYLTPRTGKWGCSTHHSGKILDGEMFPLKLCLENNEESSICNVEVSFFLLEDKNLSQASKSHTVLCVPTCILACLLSVYSRYIMSYFCSVCCILPIVVKVTYV